MQLQRYVFPSIIIPSLKSDPTFNQLHPYTKIAWSVLTVAHKVQNLPVDSSEFVYIII